MIGIASAEKTKGVIANQPAGWCGDPLALRNGLNVIE